MVNLLLCKCDPQFRFLESTSLLDRHDNLPIVPALKGRNRGSPRASCLVRLAIFGALGLIERPCLKPPSPCTYMCVCMYICVYICLYIHMTWHTYTYENEKFDTWSSMFLDPALEQKVGTWSQLCHTNSSNDLKHQPHMEGCWQSLPPPLLKSKFPLSSLSLTPSSPPRLFSMYLSNTHFSLQSLCLKCGRLFALPHQRGRVSVNVESVCMPTLLPWILFTPKQHS